MRDIVTLVSVSPRSEGREVAQALAVLGTSRLPLGTDTNVHVADWTPAADRPAIRLSLPPDDAPHAPHRGSERPYASAAVRGRDGQVDAEIDPCGLTHLYWAQGTGWCAVSTSAVALARAIESDLDQRAVLEFALTAQYWGDRTPFAGIRKLSSGQQLRLDGGRLRLLDAPTAAAVPNRTGLVGAAVIRSAVQDLAGGAPDVAVEISGGLDSRLVLAALDPTQRRGRRALTIGTPGSPDFELARRIAREHDLAHELIDTRALADLPGEELVRRVAAASSRRDHTANVLASTVLDWVEEQAGPGPRLSGQNGEFARGFYYGGFRDHPEPTDRLIARLAQWRLCTNDVVAPGLLRPGARRAASAAVESSARATIEGLGLPWLAATDELYLRERMQRWVGVAYSSASARRPVLAPFFDERFLEWARGTSARRKRGSRAMAEALVALDRDLAAIPMASGVRPATLASPLSAGPSRRVTAARKVVRKVGQRVRHSARPAGGTSRLAEALFEEWKRDPGHIEPLLRFDFLDPAMLERISSGQGPLDPASAGFLGSLMGVVEATSTAGHATR